MTSFVIGGSSSTPRTLADGEFGLIRPGGVLATDDLAVSATGDVLVSVYGALTSENSGAIQHTSGFLAVEVGSQGRVEGGGAFDGVAATNLDGALISCLGVIHAKQDALDLRGSGDILIENSGRVIGKSDGIVTDAEGAQVEIVNRGTIRGNDGGIDHLGGDLSVVNRGTIAGVDYGLDGADDRDRVDNFGEITGGVIFRQGDDFVFNRGEIDRVDLGSGDDFYIGAGQGSAGQVFGRGGRDVLVSSRADDDFTGGVAGDIFAFGPRGGDDLVRDFDAADRIDLSQFGFDSFAADVRPLLKERPNGVLLDLSDRGLTVFLRGVDLDDLHRSDFILDLMIT